MKIWILLPYKENFQNYAGAVSIFINAKISKFK